MVLGVLGEGWGGVGGSKFNMTDPGPNHTCTVSKNQDNSSNSDRGKNNWQTDRQADSTPKEAHTWSAS